MQKWTASRPHVRLAGLLGALALLAGLPALEAQSPAPPAPAQFDPSDVYFQGYLAARSAEQLEAAGDFSGALEKLEKANQLFEAIRRYHPQWKPEMVGGRSVRTMEATNRVRPLADEEMQKNRNAVAELEGGVRKPGEFKDPEDVLPLSPGILEVDPLTTRRLEDAEAEVRRLRGLLDGGADNALREASRVGDLRRQRDDLQVRLRAAETTVQGLRARLMAAPMENEMSALNRRIETLEQEREAMALALRQSRDAHTEALSRIAILQADLEIAQQQRADLERNLKTERKVANSVVAGQRRQLDALERELAKKNTQLGEANQRITGLMNELKESREAFAQLRDERDSLLRERDQMAALLKLNEAGRIQELIEQNMSLAKTLREANEKVERLYRESNADKDAYTDALRDLAIAKSQINRLHQEKRDQDQRLADLENRLRNEERALASGKASADPAEVQILRDIIRRQLRVQERRRQARDLLVEAAKDLGAKDERLAQAIQLFDAQEIALSPEEQRLIDDRQVDGEFISPFARDRASVGQATAELNRDIAVFERTAEKSFLAGRMLPTRELYQMILEQHPGHTPSLCKLGVVHLRLDEPDAAVDAFRRAIELDSGNPYAARMLGFSLMRLGEMSAAEKAVRRAVELAPTDAKSQILLATLCYRAGRRGEAESHFKAAINADPMLSEPYYNLALLCSRDRRIEDARTYYQQALERGALPDPALEKKLVSQ
ncbi:MAG: tetratricopeptide repeat protein [Akkermansiaceae bacterium]|jgi:tetratricopeptide (TPR) repeat protein|nr:tetratricopeptide repeat protein [Akkermansiaceae bacterium]